MLTSSSTPRRSQRRSPLYTYKWLVALLIIPTAAHIVAQSNNREELSNRLADSSSSVSRTTSVGKDGGKSSESPFLSENEVAAIWSTPTKSNTLVSRQNSSSESVSKQWTTFDKVVVAHAVVGSVAWLIISPTAIILARASTSSSQTYATAQSLVTTGLTLVAVVLGCVATRIGPSSGHFESVHQRMGLTLILLLLLYLLLGRFIGSHRNVDVRIPPITNLLHTILGFALSSIGFAQIWLGMELYEEKSGRETPLAAKIIWAIIVGVFSILLMAFAVKKDVKAGPKRSLSMKENYNLKKRKATVHVNKHRERGIRSDGLWVGIIGENTSGSTFVSSYTDNTVFSEASHDPGLTLYERKATSYPESLVIPTLWVNSLQTDMPLDPSQIPVYQVNQTHSDRAPASSTSLALPLTPVSPLVPIIEEDYEEEEAGEEEKDEKVLDYFSNERPTSWISSSGASIDTEWTGVQSSNSPSRNRSIKRKPVPRP